MNLKNLKASRPIKDNGATNEAWDDDGILVSKGYLGGGLPEEEDIIAMGIPKNIAKKIIKAGDTNFERCMESEDYDDAFAFSECAWGEAAGWVEVYKTKPTGAELEDRHLFNEWMETYELPDGRWAIAGVDNI